MPCVGGIRGVSGIPLGGKKGEKQKKFEEQKRRLPSLACDWKEKGGSLTLLWGGGKKKGTGGDLCDEKKITHRPKGKGRKKLSREKKKGEVPSGGNDSKISLAEGDRCPTKS